MISSRTSSDKINQLIKCMKFLARLYRNQGHTHYYQMLADYFTRVRDARQNGDFVVAHTIFFPVEILRAMDIVPMHLEFTGSLMSLFGISTNDLLTRAAEMGLAPEICSAHRLIGGALDIGVLPPADAVVCSNLVCDSAIKTGELTMEYNHCPGFVFDYPFNQTEAADEFIIRELHDVIEFLEKVSGHKMDWNKLSEVVVEVDKQLALIRRINELCKTVPSPFQPQDFLKFLVVDYMATGMPVITRYLEGLVSELSEMVAAGKGFANPERLRLMGLMIPPWHLQGDIDAVLKEHGAVIVYYPNLCDWGQEIHLDPEKPLESVAKKLAACSPMRMFGPLDERALNPIREGVKDYKIDGAVNFAHLGCRQMGPTLKICKDILDEQGIPVLNIDCDLIDATVTTADEVRNKMEQFFELLEDR